MMLILGGIIGIIIIIIVGESSVVKETKPSLSLAVFRGVVSCQICSTTLFFLV